MNNSSIFKKVEKVMKIWWNLWKLSESKQFAAAVEKDVFVNQKVAIPMEITKKKFSNF